jgi:hypothetical protein
VNSFVPLLGFGVKVVDWVMSKVCVVVPVLVTVTFTQ